MAQLERLHVFPFLRASRQEPDEFLRRKGSSERVFLGASTTYFDGCSRPLWLALEIATHVGAFFVDDQCRVHIFCRIAARADGYSHLEGIRSVPADLV